MTEFGETVEFSDADFKVAFREFDKNGDGLIEREEMKIFIAKMAGL